MQEHLPLCHPSCALRSAGGEGGTFCMPSVGEMRRSGMVQRAFSAVAPPLVELLTPRCLPGSVLYFVQASF